MTNEEKILKILESIQGQMNDMQGQINKTDRRIDILQNDVADLKEQVKVNSECIQEKMATGRIIEHKVKILNDDLFTQKAELADLKLAK